MIFLRQGTQAKSTILKSRKGQTKLYTKQNFFFLSLKVNLEFDHDRMANRAETMPTISTEHLRQPRAKKVDVCPYSSCGCNKKQMWKKNLDRHQRISFFLVDFGHNLVKRYSEIERHVVSLYFPADFQIRKLVLKLENGSPMDRTEGVTVRLGCFLHPFSFIVDENDVILMVLWKLYREASWSMLKFHTIRLYP